MQITLETKIWGSEIPEEVITTSFSSLLLEFYSLKSLVLKLFAFKKASITTWWAHWSQVKVVGVCHKGNVWRHHSSLIPSSIKVETRQRRATWGMMCLVWRKTSNSRQISFILCPLTLVTSWVLRHLASLFLFSGCQRNNGTSFATKAPQFANKSFPLSLFYPELKIGARWRKTQLVTREIYLFCPTSTSAILRNAAVGGVREGHVHFTLSARFHLWLIVCILRNIPYRYLFYQLGEGKWAPAIPLWSLNVIIWLRELFRT